jgi:hypothetical protein
VQQIDGNGVRRLKSSMTYLLGAVVVQSTFYNISIESAALLSKMDMERQLGEQF